MIKETIENIIGWIILFALVIAAALLIQSIVQVKNDPLNNNAYYCSTTDEITPRGVLIEATDKYLVLQDKVDESPLTITIIVKTYYLYLNTSLVCVNTYYDNTIEIRGT